MSVVLVTDCPYCTAENSSFSYMSCYNLLEDHRLYWMMFKCPRCHAPVVAKGVNLGGVHPKSASGDVEKYFSRIEVYPKRHLIEAPEHLPPEVLNLYMQACRCRRMSKMTDAAGMTYRKTLETSLKILSPDIDVWKLEKRIEKMKEQNLLTSAMAEWAHTIRLDGNEATHSAEPTEEEIEDLHNFVHVFLLYTFTLPAMVAARKQ